MFDVLFIVHLGSRFTLSPLRHLKGGRLSLPTVQPPLVEVTRNVLGPFHGFHAPNSPLHGRKGVRAFLLCLISVATTSAWMASRFAEDKHLVSKTSTRRMHRLPMIFAFVRFGGWLGSLPASLCGGNLGSRYRRVGPSSMHQGCLNLQAPARSQFTSMFIFIPQIYSQHLKPPCAPLYRAWMFCWAGRPQGTERTRVSETAGWPPVRPADTVIQPFGYHEGCRGILFLL